MDRNSLITGESEGSLGGVFMYHRDIFKKLGGFRDWVCAADTEFIRRAQAAGASIMVSRTYDYNYRRHGRQLTQEEATNSKSALRKGYMKLISAISEAEYVNPEIECIERLVSNN